MNERFTYDPEDLESLLIHKSFGDLYPEEKLFVLKHMDSEEEYETMRQTLQAVQSSSESDSNLSMPASTKATLMDAFKEERKKGAWFTLNGFFALLLPPQKPWYGKPAFQLATVGLLFFVGASFFNVFAPERNLQIAEAHTEEMEPVKAVPKQETAASPKKTDSNEEELPSFRDETEKKSFTPANANELAEESLLETDLRAQEDETRFKKEADASAEVLDDFSTADVALETEDMGIATPKITPGATDASITKVDENAPATAFFDSPSVASADFSTGTEEFTVTAEKVEMTENESQPVLTNADDLANVMPLLEAAY
ncbi:MAG: hypothetical protein P8O05_04320 [Flavobacteriales bacterium]|nr:hypothetical protein [Flavobacteriales bacterium]